MALHFRIAAATVAVALLGADLAFAQNSATEIATATGAIFQPIVLSKQTDLSFGTIVKPASGGGTVTVDGATGVRSLGGDGALLTPGSGGPHSRASFTVVGEGGQTFSIAVPANLTMTRTGGSETVVAALTPTATSGTLSNALGQQGSANFGVGGQLPITSSTASGAYAGSFMVTVAYN